MEAKLKHLKKWDGNPTMNHRLAHACPLCGFGIVTTPLGPPEKPFLEWQSAHESCMKEAGVEEWVEQPS